MQNFFKAMGRLCAVIIGAVFFVSGTLKQMDPMGTSLIVDEYFTFLHLGFLKPLAYITGFLLALLESVTGAALLTGTFHRLARLVSGIMLGVFTLLTAVLAIANPAMDCGCFGEAVHLTHAQSLIKNLVLDALWAGAFLPWRDRQPSRKYASVAFGIAALSALVFGIFSTVQLPPVDFMDYASGEELMASDGSDGTLLTFSDEFGDYHDEYATEGSVLLISVYNPERMSEKRWQKIAALSDSAMSEGFVPLLLVAGTRTDVPEYFDEPYFADRRTLLTLNRSNGGCTYVEDGMVVAKWPSRRAPSAEKMSELASTSPLENASAFSRRGNMLMQGYLLYVFAVMLLL